MKYEIINHSDGTKVVPVGLGGFSVLVVKYVGHQSRVDIQLPNKYNGLNKSCSSLIYLASPDDAEEWATNMMIATKVARALDDADSDAKILEVASNQVEITLEIVDKATV